MASTAKLPDVKSGDDDHAASTINGTSKHLHCDDDKTRSDAEQRLSHGETVEGHTHIPHSEPAAAPERAPSTPRPPLPPRRTTRNEVDTSPISSIGSLRLSRGGGGGRPQLLSKATTALSLARIYTSGPADTSPAATLKSRASSLRQPSYSNLDRQTAYGVGDNASIRSYAPTLSGAVDNESFFAGFEDINRAPSQPPYVEGDVFFERKDVNFEMEYEHEYDRLDDVDHEGLNEGVFMSLLYKVGLVLTYGRKSSS